ncbi:MAG: glycoside hydrolase domain-containing protein [Victivallales bacterium]
MCEQAGSAAEGVRAGRGCRQRLTALIIISLFTLYYQSLATGDDNLLFYCSYDKSLDADIAQGQKEATVIGNSHLVDGKSGKGMIQEGLGKVSYSTAGNIKGNEGAVAMWVKPVNWSGKDNRFEFMFMAGNFPQQGKRHIQIYKYFSAGLYCLARNQDKKLLLQSNIADWKTGEWHHLAFSWSKSDNMCALYIDGEQVKTDTFDQGILPVEDGHFGDAMHVNTVVSADNCDKKDQTVIDELYIYGRALGKRDILNLIDGVDKKNKQNVPVITIPMTEKSPTIDGRLSPGEWEGATEINTFVINEKRGFEGRKTRAFVTYDAANLYIAIQSQIKEGDLNVEMKSNAKKRDSAVYSDDAVEIYIKPPDSPMVTFMANSIGSIYDMRDGKVDWNGNWETYSGMEFPWWTIEIKASFKDLGLLMPKRGEEWRMNICRDWQNPQVFTSLADTSSFAEIKNMPIFTFDPACNPYSINLDIAKILTKEVCLQTTVKNRNKQESIYDSQIYLYNTNNEKTIIEAKKLTIPGGEKNSVILTKDMAEYNLSQYQNKFGLQLINNGKIVQQSEYYLKTYPPVELSAMLVPSKNSIKYYLNITGLRHSISDIAVDYQIKDYSEKTVIQWKQSVVEKRQLDGVMKIDAPIPEKEYVLTVSINDKTTGKTVEQKETRFSFPAKPSWLDTTAGISEKVPPPWTPLQYKNNMISVWGRDYYFGENALPDKIFSQGEDLLTGPVQLFMETEDGQVDLSGVGMKFNYAEKGEQKAEFSSYLKGIKCDVKISGLLEYDGFLKYRVELTPNAPMTVNRFFMKIPVKKKHSYFTHINDGETYARINDTTDSYGNHKFCSQALFCSDERALAWFMESNEKFRPSYTEDVVNISPTGEANTLQVNFIQTPTSIGEKWVYEFGFQAAPLKPMPDGWRSWIQSYPNGRLNTLSTITHLWSWSRWYGFLYPISPDNFRSQIAEWRKASPDVRISPYMCQYILSTIAPEYKTYSEEWMKKPKIEIQEFGPKYPGTSVVACMGAKSYTDFWLYNLDRFLSEYDINGIYWDAIDPVRCENEVHGHGFVDERGIKQPTTDIYNYREFYKRAYVILKNKHPNAIVTGHSSQRRNLPTISFADVVYDGEQFVSQTTANPNYCTFLKEKYYRALFGTQFGLVPMFLPAYYNNEDETKKTTTPTESVYAYALTYGALVHAARLNNKIADEVLQIEQDFGMKDAEYIAPGSNQLADLIELQPNNNYVEDNLRAAIYAKKGEMLIAVANFGSENTPLNIKLKPNKYIRLNNIKVFDKRKNACVEKNGDFYKIESNKYNFTLLKIEN